MSKSSDYESVNKFSWHSKTFSIVFQECDLVLELEGIFEAILDLSVMLF